MMHRLSQLAVVLLLAMAMVMCGCLGGDDGGDEGNISPTCTLSASPEVGEMPLNVTFSMTASDNDGSISTWQLDIDNDGDAEYNGTGTPPGTLTHEYAIDGEYQARLTVADDKGGMGSIVYDVEVRLAHPATTPVGEMTGTLVENGTELRFTFGVVSPTTLYDWCEISINPPEGDVSTFTIVRHQSEYDVSIDGVGHVKIMDYDGDERIDEGDYISIVGDDVLATGEWSLSLIYSYTDNAIASDIYEIVE